MPYKKPRSSHHNSRKAHRQTVTSWCGLAVAGLALIAMAWLLGHSLTFRNPPPEAALPINSTNDEPKVFAQYAGSSSCQPCHQDAYSHWLASHHGLAERLSIAAFDRSAFDPPRTIKRGAETFSARMDNTNYIVTTLGLVHTNEPLPVVRVIGHDPLRQFLVAAPGGRFQALEMAFDPHRNQWFDVFGDEDRQPGEWGHWTGRGMNWNSMCAACHNTRLAKNYDITTDSYHTTMAERTVGCESCHGPLKSHVDWERQYASSGTKDPHLPQLTHEQTVENCGFCHARRSDLTGDFKPGDSFFDHQSFAIVDASDNFYPDGQVHGEDYEFSAFLGSKMHARGVTCTDCHDPHSGQTRLPGNQLCLHCHNGSYPNAPAINPVLHSHHKVFGYDSTGQPLNGKVPTAQPADIKETGGECINCHMPQTVYMQRHVRHDHGFTIPDPLLTREFNVPNACNRCHTDRSTDWALAATTNWFGAKMERPTRTRAQWIARARTGDTAARDPLIKMLTVEPIPYWQAVAAGLLGQWVDEPSVKNALFTALDTSHPLVREQAVHALEPLTQATGSPITDRLLKMLTDPSLSVRIAVEWALRADLPPAAAAELQHSLDVNVDQPAGQLQQAAYHLAKNQMPEALAHYQKAVDWDPNSAPLRHELAVALSLTGHTPEAIEQLKAAARLDPNDAEYQFKLGLAYNELGDTQQTTAALEKAVALNPHHARAWFNLGLLRNTQGQTASALDALARAETADPHDPQIPYALATILAHLNQIPEARRAAQRALELDPNYTEAKKLLENLNTP